MPPPPAGSATTAAATGPARRGQPAVLVLSCALTGVIAFAAGYLLGRGLPSYLSDRDIPPFTASHESRIVPPAKADASSSGPASPAPKPAETPPATAPAPPPNASSAISAAPEAALRAFLAATSVEERRKRVVSPALVGPRMEAWYAAHPEGAVEADGVKFLEASTDSGSRRLIFVFQVKTGKAPDGFGVPVVESDDGWRVDWDSFIEFHGDRFQHFVAGQEGESGNYRLLVKEKDGASPAFPGSDKLTPFVVRPPLPEREQTAYVVTGSPLHKQLALATGGGQAYPLGLRLDRRPLADGKTYLEISAITADSWLPRLR